MDLELRNQAAGSLSAARMKVEVVSLFFPQSAVNMTSILGFIPYSFNFKKRDITTIFLSNEFHR